MIYQDEIAVSLNGAASPVEAVAPPSFESNVRITFKKVAPLNIEIDIDALTVADLEFVDRLSNDKTSTVELIDFLGRVIPDTDIKTIPLRAIPELANAVMSAIGGASDPNDSASD